MQSQPLANAWRSTLRENPLFGWLFGKKSPKYVELAQLAKKIYQDDANGIQYPDFVPYFIEDANTFITTPIQHEFAEKMKIVNSTELKLFFSWLKQFLGAYRNYNNSSADSVIQLLLQLRASIITLTGDGMVIDIYKFIEGIEKSSARHRILRGKLDTK